MTSSEGYSFTSEEWRDGISKVVGKLAASSKNLIVLRDNPRPNFDVPTCLSRKVWRPHLIPSAPCQFEQRQNSDVYGLQVLAVRHYKNARALDLSESICPRGACVGEINNVIIFRDSNHLTSSFVRRLEAILAAEIDRTVVNFPPDGSA
jgi:hypothetical protein